MLSSVLPAASPELLKNKASEAFVQPLPRTVNVSNVTKMRGMFANAESFNQPLNNWNRFLGRRLIAAKEKTQSKTRSPMPSIPELLVVGTNCGRQTAQGCL